MQERDIDALIKSFRDKQDTLLNNKSTEEHGFIDPTKETPVETSQVLRFLDLSWADPILQKLYPRFQWIKHRLYPRVKLMMFQKLRPDLRKVAETYRVSKQTQRSHGTLDSIQRTYHVMRPSDISSTTSLMRKRLNRYFIRRLQQ